MGVASIERACVGVASIGVGVAGFDGTVHKLQVSHMGQEKAERQGKEELQKSPGKWRERRGGGHMGVSSGEGSGTHVSANEATQSNTIRLTSCWLVPAESTLTWLLHWPSPHIATGTSPPTTHGASI